MLENSFKTKSAYLITLKISKKFLILKKKFWGEGAGGEVKGGSWGAKRGKNLSLSFLKFGNSFFYKNS